MTEHLCVTCPVLRPTQDPRVYERANCCEGCRAEQAGYLAALPDQFAQLLAEEHVNAGEWVDGRRHRDPIAHRLPAGPTKVGAGPRISGSPNPTVPGLERLNLLSPVYLGPGAAFILEEDPYQPGGSDQHGNPAPLLLLDSWAADWIYYGLGDIRPVPTMVELCRWLSDRLDAACNTHPAIDEFAKDLSDLSRTVAAVARTDRGRGEKVGRCPAILRDESRCATQLRVDPYADVIACHRCGSSWHRRSGEWLKLRAEQLKAAA